MLRLIKSLTPPDRSGHWHCVVAPNGAYVGMAAGDLLEVWDASSSGGSPIWRFHLPEDVPIEPAAIHPGGQAIALANVGQVIGLSRDGSHPRFAGSLASEWGAPLALSFSGDGRILWASFETDGTHRVCALDWESGTLALYGDVECPGPAGARHRIEAHPAEKVIALEITAPRGGTSVSFVRVTDYRLELVDSRVGHAINACNVAGFSSDGERVAGIFENRAELWDWGSGEQVASIALEAGSRFRWPASFVGPSLVALVHRTADDSDRLAIFDENLSLRDGFTWQRRDQQELRGLRGLVDQRLLMLGDRRAGLFGVDL